MLSILRRQKRLTQAEVARAVRVSAVHYRRIENGDANASEELIAELATFLGTTPARLHEESQ
jgi:transcriptional regulator with XRE-family HTH domain